MSQFIEMFGSVDDNLKSYDIKKVGDFAECFAGATPSTKIPSYWDDGNIPWMSSGEVHKGRIQDTDAKITQQGYDGCSTKMIPIHSIVVALAGQGKTRGTVAINEIELCTNQSLCAIVPNEEINYEYLFHNLRGRYKELRSMSGDVDGRGGLNLKHIQSIKVIVPPMSEQMKFVSIARQADKSGFDELKSQFIEMFKGDFPKLSWEKCLTIINGKKYDDDYQESGTYPICGSGGIMGYGERMLCPKDTVILGRKGNINSPIYMETDYWIIDTAFCFDVDRTKLHPKYFYFWCKLFDFTRYNKQGVLPSLTKNDLLKIEMPIPPMELQTKFVDIIEQADKSGSVLQYRIAC